MDRVPLKVGIAVHAGIHQPALQVQARRRHGERGARIKADGEVVILLLQPAFELIAKTEIQRELRRGAEVVLNVARVVVDEVVARCGDCDIA